MNKKSVALGAIVLAIVVAVVSVTSTLAFMTVKGFTNEVVISDPTTSSIDAEYDYAILDEIRVNGGSCNI